MRMVVWYIDQVKTNEETQILSRTEFTLSSNVSENIKGQSNAIIFTVFQSFSVRGREVNKASKATRGSLNHVGASSLDLYEVKSVPPSQNTLIP